MSRFSIQTYVANDGMPITPESYEQVLAYDVEGNLKTTTVVAHNGKTYIQTLTWTNGKLTKISKWIRQ